MRSMTFALPAIERLVYGKPAAQTLRAEAERCGAKRVFLIVSGTMNRTTDEVEKVRAALANHTWRRMPRERRDAAAPIPSDALESAA